MVLGNVLGEIVGVRGVASFGRVGGAQGRGARPSPDLAAARPLPLAR